MAVYLCAARGQEGTQMIRGLAARDAQNRQLRALEDRVGPDRETMEMQERLAQLDVYVAIYGSAEIDSHILRQAKFMELDREDPRVLDAVLAQLAAGAQRFAGLGRQGGLTPPNVEEAQAYLDANP